MSSTLRGDRGCFHHKQALHHAARPAFFTLVPLTNSPSRRSYLSSCRPCLRTFSLAILAFLSWRMPQGDHARRFFSLFFSVTFSSSFFRRLPHAPLIPHLSDVGLDEGGSGISRIPVLAKDARQALGKNCGALHSHGHPESFLEVVRK